MCDTTPPRGYHRRSWRQRSSGGLPRILQKAHVFRTLLTRSQLAILPCDWFPDKINHAQLLQKLRKRRHQEASKGVLADDAAWYDTLTAVGLGHANLDTGHISPGWHKMFAAGQRFDR